MSDPVHSLQIIFAQFKVYKMHCTYLHLDEKFKCKSREITKLFDMKIKNVIGMTFILSYRIFPLTIEALNPTLLIGWKCDLWFVSTDQKLQRRL